MPEDFSQLPQELHAVVRYTAAHVAEASHRIPSAEVERLLANHFGLSRRRVRAVIRYLLGTGELVYTYEHGCSFLEPSYRKPVRVGKRVVLVPADQPEQADGETDPVTVAVRIAPGASFGSGRHPTTRLAIRGIDQALGSLSSAAGPDRSLVLDIGTGSGVLVIAAVKLGAGRGVGIDTDACARFEARQNIDLNRLTDNIRVSEDPLQKIKPTGRFDIIIANLRLPTLLRLASPIVQLAKPRGRLVLSGIRVEEIDGLMDAYRVHDCPSVWVAKEKGWGAVVCERQTEPRQPVVRADSVSCPVLASFPEHGIW